MPEPLYFPRWRYYTMQTIMWIVLGGTVGLAALLDRHLLGGSSLAFGEKTVHDGLGYAIPNGWKGSWTTGPGNVAIFTATDNLPADSPTGHRTLTITQQHLDRIMSPMDYLATRAPPGMDMSAAQAEWTSLDGWPTISFQGITRTFGGFNQQSRGEFMAWCTVLPNKEAITIRLEHSGEMNPIADNRFVKDLMDIMDFPPGLKQDNVGHFDFADGSKVNVPQDDVMVCTQPDPLCSDRTVLWTDPDPNSAAWAWEQFIPVEMIGDNPAESLRQALSMNGGTDPENLDRSYRWLSASVSDLGNRRWKIDPADPSDGPIMRCAYLVGGSGSRGILVILGGLGTTPGDVLTAAWAAIADQIHPAGSDDRVAILGAGEALANASNPPSSGARFWILDQEKKPFGWIHLKSGNSSKPERNSAFTNFDGSATQTGYDCDLSQGGSDFQTSTVRLDALGSERMAFRSVFAQTLNISQKISGRIRMLAGPMAIPAMGRPTPFVPGAILPDLLARPISQPAAFWTDRVIGHDEDIMEMPALVILRPIAGSSPDIRGVEMEINGTGQLSRWYFRMDDGGLDHADFPGGIHLSPATQQQILDAFSGDPRLTPIPPQ